MNILYKYCDIRGQAILKDPQNCVRPMPELRLPFITQVNDVYDCLPYITCPADIDSLRRVCLDIFEGNPPANFEQRLREAHPQIREDLVQNTKTLFKDSARESCLLSVSKNARNPLMWAHYAQQHKGFVLGIDFDAFFHSSKLTLHPVKYSKQRPTLDISTKTTMEALEPAILTKAIDWQYEEEYRTLLGPESLIDYKKSKLAFMSADHWFLRFNPKAVRQIIFGMRCSDDLKSSLLSLKSEYPHVDYFQAKESQDYALNLLRI